MTYAHYYHAGSKFLTYRNLGLHGRLGNALWQLGATLGVARRTSAEPIFPATWQHRPFFSFPDHMFGDVPDEALDTFNSPAIEYLNLSAQALPYLQVYELIKDVLPELRSYLRPSWKAQQILQPYLDKFPESPVLGIHVRRGDNVVDAGVPNKSDYYYLPPLQYYQRGIDLLARDPEIKLACFSDDIAWCRSNIPAAFYGDGRAQPKEHEPDFLTTEPRDWIDLFLLSTSDYLVLSNSTFGVWAAFMANVPTDHVVRADKYFGPLLTPLVNAEMMFDPDWRIVAS